MSLDSDLGGSLKIIEAGFDYTKTLPTTITAGGSSNTVGAYTELLAAADNKGYSRIKIIIRPESAGTQGDILINIAYGAATSERDVFKELWVPSATTSNAAIYEFDFPVQVPPGVRISANCQGDSASKVIGVSLQLEQGKLSSDAFTIVDTIGSATATTDGITVNAAGTINTFGSWTELITSTGKAYGGFVVACHKKDGSMTDMSQTYDIGVGSASSEQIIYCGWQVRPDGSERVQGAISPFFGVGVSASSRLAARNQATSTNADANLDFVIYGVR